MEQNSEEWIQHRKGKFTSSQIYRLMTEPKTKEAKERGDLSEGAKTYILECIAESIGGEIPFFENTATKRGHELEPMAKKKYAFEMDIKVFGVGFIEVDSEYGGSPDGKVDDNGLEGGLEIKCPYNSVHHLEHCMINDWEYFKKNHPDYYWQCVSHIKTLNVGFCDFVSYDPRIQHSKCLHVFRLERNPLEIALMESKINKAKQVKKELIKQIGL